MNGGSYHCTGGSGQNHPKEREMQEGKVVEKDLQIAVERREAKGKGERERYNYLITEFQRLVKR